MEDILKLRNLIVSQPIAEQRLYGPELIDDVVSFATAALPILDFGWKALA